MFKSTFFYRLSVKNLGYFAEKIFSVVNLVIVSVFC